MNDIDGLKTLAKAATPCNARVMKSLLASMRYCAIDLDNGVALHCQSRNDAKYYSAANPQTVLSLLDALTRLQAENAELRAKCDHIMTEHGKRLEEVVRLREDAERYRWMAANPSERASWEFCDNKAEMDERIDAARQKHG